MIKRNTSQRAVIYNAIHELKHSSIADIIDYIQKTSNKASVATIYRNLEVLVDAGLIKVISANGQIYYETVKDEHYHFVCKKCGKVYDINPSENDIKIDYPPTIGNDEIYSYELTFYGICEDCKDKE